MVTVAVMPRRIQALARALIGNQGIALGLLALAGVYLTSLYSYLLFHSLAELFSIVVAGVIFVIAWSARRLYDNAFLLFIGIAFFFIGAVDLLHALAYEGMGVFERADANLPTQLWIAGRGLEAASLLIAPVLVGRKLRPRLVFLSYTLVTGVLLAAVLAWRVFPACYVAASGLTPFKIGAEYAISATLVTALVVLWTRRAAFDPSVLRSLAAGVALTVASEVAFTQYIGVYDTANLIGHLLKIAAVYCFYKAIVQTAMTRPFDLLFRELSQREQELRHAQQMQELVAQFIVHDLRSPLTSVLAGLDALGAGVQDAALPDAPRATSMMSRGSSATRRQLVEAAKASASWVLTLADSLLDSSRLESGKMPLQVERLDARELVDSSWRYVAPWAELGRVRLEVDGDDEGLAVSADRELAVRVLVNLFSNAMKHSPPDSAITVRIAPGDDGAVAFSVADQGPGIPPEWAQQVFEKFGQVEARQAGAAGVGLGLHFCRLAVEAQGGRIALRSAAHTGTTVTFSLPPATGT
jgi:signal transduction histidine kinase